MTVLRRNAFAVPPGVRPMPEKKTPDVRERLQATVSPDVARVAAYLLTDTVMGDLFDKLRNEAVEKLASSPLGAAGIEAREVARYELEALGTIRSRLEAMAAENRLHQDAEATVAV